MIFIDKPDEAVSENFSLAPESTAPAQLGDQFPRKKQRLRQRLLAQLPWLPAPLAQSAREHEDDQDAFSAYMLLPGFSIGFHASVLGRSRSAIRTYLADAQAAAQVDPAIQVLAANAIAAIRPEDGLEMAVQRKDAHLPYWSRLAIREFHRRGMTRLEIADAFLCSPGTVAGVLQGRSAAYKPLSGVRLLSSTQVSPPNKKASTTSWRQ